MMPLYIMLYLLGIKLQTLCLILLSDVLSSDHSQNTADDYIYLRTEVELAGLWSNSNVYFVSAVSYLQRGG